MAGAAQWLLVVILGLSLLIPGPAFAHRTTGRAVLQSTLLTQVSPAACPATGCAPGQRINMRFDYELGSYSSTPSSPPTPNIKVCFYAPTGLIATASINNQPQPGGVTGLAYTPAADCAQDSAPPTGYTLISAWQTEIVNTFAFSDSLDLSFRFAIDAASTGKILARLFERGDSGWQRTQQAFTANISIAPRAAINYAAATASQCDAGNYQPCYLNSGDDLPEGIGTGLKDAIDAAQPGAIIYLLEQYPIKNNTVRVNKALQIAGINRASLTASGSLCSEAMLLIEDAVKINELAINDGPGCTTTNRTLIAINSSKNVLIENNLLSGGDKGILIRDNAGAVTIRFNQIENNAAQAVYSEGGSILAPITIEANNIVGNGSASSNQQVECAAGQSGVLPTRKANHNYWGSATAPNQQSIHCVLTPGRQLGAPIQPSSAAYGLQAQRVTVTDSKTYAFNNEIGFQLGSDTGSFDLTIVNHGYAQADATPFRLNSGINPCSSFWDVFLPDGVNPNGTLNLFFKYNKSSACLAAINSNQYCDQTNNPARYPLWWYDPATNVTDQWDTTGQNPAGSNAGGGSGQVTTCRMTDNEIQVSIDASGRPNLANDLAYLPFFAGIQVIKTFRLLASSNMITVDWSTNNEPDVTGFTVQRSADGQTFGPITDLLPRKGSALAGANYQFVDTGRVSGATYYYRLQITRPDNLVFYSNILTTQGTSSTATITNTPTRTGGPTTTSTITPGPSPTLRPPTSTRTPVPTRIPFINPTRAPSATRTTRPGTPTRAGLVLITTTGTPGTSGPLTRTLSGTLATTQPSDSLGTQPAYPPPEQTQTTAGDYPTPDGQVIDTPNSYPGPDDETTSTTDAYPGPVDQITVTPITLPGTAVAGLVSPTATYVTDAQEPVKDQKNLDLLRAILAGYFGGSALIGLLGLWFLVIYKKPNF